MNIVYTILRHSCTLLNDSTHACMYGTAQRQLDTYTHAASWVKITSCIQYLNRCPLDLCPNQEIRRACAPANVTLILNKLFNEIYNIDSIFTMILRILSLYVPIEP